MVLECCLELPARNSEIWIIKEKECFARVPSPADHSFYCAYGVILPQKHLVIIDVNTHNSVKPVRLKLYKCTIYSIYCKCYIYG